MLPTDIVGMMGIDTDICLGIDTDIVDIVGGWKDLPWNPNEKTVYISINPHEIATPMKYHSLGIGCLERSLCWDFGGALLF